MGVVHPLSIVCFGYPSHSRAYGCEGRVLEEPCVVYDESVGRIEEGRRCRADLLACLQERRETPQSGSHPSTLGSLAAGDFDGVVFDEREFVDDVLDLGRWFRIGDVGLDGSWCLGTVCLASAKGSGCCRKGKVLACIGPGPNIDGVRGWINLDAMAMMAMGGVMSDPQIGHRCTDNLVLCASTWKSRDKFELDPYAEMSLRKTKSNGAYFSSGDGGALPRDTCTNTSSVVDNKACICLINARRRDVGQPSPQFIC
jgi:hypothetical protein